jgi:hypothetical protein
MKAETDHLEDPEVNGRITLKWMLDWDIFV